MSLGEGEGMDTRAGAAPCCCAGGRALLSRHSGSAVRGMRMHGTFTFRKKVELANVIPVVGDAPPSPRPSKLQAHHHPRCHRPVYRIHPALSTPTRRRRLHSHGRRNYPSLARHPAHHAPHERGSAQRKGTAPDPTVTGRPNTLPRRPMAHIGDALADSICAVGPLPLLDDDPLWPRPRLRRRLLRPPLQATRMASHGRTRIRRRTGVGGVRHRQYKPTSPQRQHAKYIQSFKRAAAPPRDGLRVVRS
jgi:hypothetical protein